MVRRPQVTSTRTRYSPAAPRLAPSPPRVSAFARRRLPRFTPPLAVRKTQSAPELRGQTGGATGAYPRPHDVLSRRSSPACARAGVHAEFNVMSHRHGWAGLSRCARLACHPRRAPTRAKPTLPRSPPLCLITTGAGHPATLRLGAQAVLAHVRRTSLSRFAGRRHSSPLFSSPSSPPATSPSAASSSAQSTGMSSRWCEAALVGARQLHCPITCPALRRFGRRAACRARCPRAAQHSARALTALRCA